MSMAVALQCFVSAADVDCGGIGGSDGMHFAAQAAIPAIAVLDGIAVHTAAYQPQMLIVEEWMAVAACTL